MKLMYSSASGDEHMGRAQLEYIPTPEPRGPRHMPYSFFEYANQVAEQLEANEFVIEEEEYAVTKDKMRMFGIIQIGSPYLDNEYFKLTVGIRGSHDMKIPRGLCGGQRVIVCSNLMFGGELANFKTKQTLNIDDRIHDFIKMGIDNLVEYYNVVETRMERMKDTIISQTLGDHVLVDIYRQGGLSAAQLGVAVKEWVEPSYEQHAENGWSTWRLLNAGTQALKPRGENSNPFTVQNRSRIIDDVVYNLVNN